MNFTIGAVAGYGEEEMLLILPAVFAAFYAYERKRTKEVPSALGRTVLWFELSVIIITNLFSVFSRLNRATVFVAWLTVFFVIVAAYGKNYGMPANIFFKQIKSGRYEEKRTAEGIKGVRNDRGGKYICRLMLGIILVLSAVLLIGAIFTVPYNYDSMTYHLARVGYWMDHQSVAHYVSNIDRQIYSPVLAEYNLLHILLLSGNDTFANFLQYFSMFIAAYFIYQSAGRLGTDRTFSLFGAFVFMLMPLTISQSITTQNDLFATVFFAIFVYELIGVIKWERLTLDREQLRIIVMLGLTVAFAYLAKTSVCASMLFFMPWLLIARLQKRDRLPKLLGAALTALVSIVLPISETLVRTFLSSGSIMTDTASGDIMVATKNIAYVFVNILKNFSLLITQHLWRPLNGFVYRIAIHTGQALGVEVNHEAIAYHGFDFLHHMNMGEDMYSHDKAPSAFAAYLAVAAGVLLMILAIRLIAGRKKETQAAKEQQSLSLGFAVSAWLSLGFIMALLRWQPWGTRLMYPALAVTTIMSANLLWLFMQKNKAWIRNGILGILIVLCTVLSIPAVTYNMKPAADFIKGGCQDRLAYYFTFNQRRSSYEELLGKAKEEGVTDIGLMISGDGYDYPLWLMFHESYPEGKLRHIIADKETTAPEAILMVERDEFALGAAYEYAGQSYICTYVNEENHDAYLSKVK